MAAAETSAVRPRTSTRAHPDRYLIRRRRVYFFQRQVPRRHRAAMGCTNFTRSLNTGDIRTARQRRDKLNAEFEALLASLTPEVDAWSPRGILQAAQYIRTAGEPETFAAEVVRIAEHHPDRNITTPDLAAAVEQGLATMAVGEAGILLSAAADEHLEALQRRALPSTVAARRRHLDALRAFCGDLPVGELTKRRLGQWAQGVAADDSMSSKTRSNMVGNVVAFGGWLVDAGLWVENHAAALRKHLKASTRGTSTESTVRPWAVAEVRELLSRMDAGLPTDDPLHALVRIAFYSGMRREEIANLRGRDIEVVDGVTVMQVREGKTASAIRSVPVHPAIAHLVTDVAPDAYAVPLPATKGGQDGRRAAAAGSRFSRLKADWGFDASLNLHGARRAFLKRLESAGVAQNIAETLVGHARRSLSYGRYSDGADLAVLAEAVERVSYGMEGSA